MNLDEMKNLENENSTTSNVVVFDAPKTSENQDNQTFNGEESNKGQELDKAENLQELNKDSDTQ